MAEARAGVRSRKPVPTLKVPRKEPPNTAASKTPSADLSDSSEGINEPTNMREKQYDNTIGKLAAARMESPEPRELPEAIASQMKASLGPVLKGLRHDCTRNDLADARLAFKSWPKPKWVTFDGVPKSKPTHGWAVDQYAMPGFAHQYAEFLHVPRVAATHAAMTWLLGPDGMSCPADLAESTAHAAAPSPAGAEPGCPGSGSAIIIGDLGAGTSAACCGASIALREICGQVAHRVYPIDMTSSSTKFRRSFQALVQPHLYPGRKGCPLPMQNASQYLTSDAPGVEEMTHSLLSQLALRNERPPHFVVASFVLHYLSAAERDQYYRTVCAAATRPFVLLIIKGCGTAQRPTSETVGVPCVFLGRHFFTGNPNELNPRIVEVHACLIEPSSGSAAPEDAGDAWVRRVFGASLARTAESGPRDEATMLPFAPPRWTHDGISGGGGGGKSMRECAQELAAPAREDLLKKRGYALTPGGTSRPVLKAKTTDMLAQALSGGALPVLSAQSRANYCVQG